MPKPLLIIISGPPGTGKTTLGKRLASELHLPFINKDSIKELLFDALGWSDRVWSQKLGAATYPLLYYCTEALLSTGCSFIVEGIFSPQLDNARFCAFKEHYGFESLQIQCVTEGEVLFQRFRQRAESGERHPGHVDHLSYEEAEARLLRGRDDALDIGGTIVEVDTTDFEKIDDKKLLKTLQHLLYNS